MKILKGNSGKILEYLIKFIAYISILPILGILIYIVLNGVSAINWSFLSSMPENSMREGGIFPAILGTIYLAVLTLIIAVPFGVLTGIYLVEYSKKGIFLRLIELTILNLAGTPSIIYGLFGMALFVVYFKLGVSLISGALTLSIMSLPVIITATREALQQVPDGLREASLALGATKWETIQKVVLPSASPGIITGIILSISRATGETAPIMFTAVSFYLPFLPESIWDQIMALPYHLFVISTQVPNMAKETIQGTLFVLVFITVGFNLLGAYIREYLKK